ncbi:A-kinase anchor protein 17B isoform X2 [Coturnix japonica]|uniref:A-kinase anchor protein 17B isoform X2 n=1 Tax=Coturnix japonica TaxID=93934 RepID=UPI000776F832|nr:A-kinase anchor protein 17B isoform X2 [Coturnix japonica]
MWILGDRLLIISSSKSDIQAPRTQSVKQVSSKLSHIDNYLEKNVMMNKKFKREKRKLSSRREERQIEGDEKHPQKQHKVPAEEQQWPENVPEWEERKSLLAQRRVESIRLLTVLLNHVKDFVQLASQKVDPSLGIRKDDSFSGTALKAIHQKQINSCYLMQKDLEQKEELKCQLTQKSSKLCSEEGDLTAFCASTSPRVKTILNDPAAALSFGRLTGRDAYNSFGCGSLQITVTQDCKVIESLEGRDCQALNVVRTQTGSEDGYRKQKVYETDEFIHYLLNYYQTPSYERVSLVTKNSANNSWWKRVVCDDDSGFHISLRNKQGRHLREVSLVQNLNDRNCTSDDNCRLVITAGESTDTVRKNKTYADRLAKKMHIQRSDTLSVDHLMRAEPNHSLDCTAAAQDEEFEQEDGRNDVTKLYRTCRSAHRLKDLLEEISDSKYFSEAHSGAMKNTERSEQIYSNCNKGCLPAGEKERKLLVYFKNVTLEGQTKESSKCNFCSNSAHEDLARQCDHNIEQSCKRSSSKLRHEGQKSERHFGEEERNTLKMKKKRKKLSSDFLSDECGFSETESCIQLESLRKIRRKCNKAFHNKVKFKTLHAGTAAPGITTSDCFPLQETLRRTGERQEMRGN